MMPVRDATNVGPDGLGKRGQLLVLVLQVDVVELVQDTQEVMPINYVFVGPLRMADFAERLLHPPRYALRQYHILFVQILLRFLDQDPLSTLLRVLLLFLLLFVPCEVIVVQVLDQLRGRTNKVPGLSSTEGRIAIVLLRERLPARLLTALLRMPSLAILGPRALGPVQSIKHGQLLLLLAEGVDANERTRHLVRPSPRADFTQPLLELPCMALPRGIELTASGLFQVHGLLLADLLAANDAAAEALAAAQEKVVMMLFALGLAALRHRCLLVINQIVNHEFIDLVVRLIKIVLAF